MVEGNRMADHPHSRAPRGHTHLLAARVASLLMLAAAAPVPEGSGGRPLTIDDVLRRETLDRATTSPDGEWVAVVVRRGAGSGEAYGRAVVEADPTRSDVWLISTRTGERRRVTDGAGRAAGYWCATWSPDGRRLAMLSTASQGAEPRGGDNVRLYVWDRGTGTVKRLGDWPVMTQTRYGSPLDQLDLRGGARGAGDGADVAHACTADRPTENAPFLWLDDRRLLVATLAAGEVSAALGHYTRPYRVAADDAARLREGVIPTGSAVASGAARKAGGATDARVTLRVADAVAGTAFSVGTVPAYPFRGALTASVSPDGQRLAVMATVGMLPPVEGRSFPNPPYEEWAIERRLGFTDLRSGAAVRWATMPAAARLPLELYGWSPDGRGVAFGRGATDIQPLPRCSSRGRIPAQWSRRGSGRSGVRLPTSPHVLRPPPIGWTVESSPHGAPMAGGSSWRGSVRRPCPCPPRWRCPTG